MISVYMHIMDILHRRLSAWGKSSTRVGNPCLPNCWASNDCTRPRRVLDPCIFSLAILDIWSTNVGCGEAYRTRLTRTFEPTAGNSG